MNEVVLRQFFDGHASASELDADVEGTLVRDGPAGGPHVYHYNVLLMAGQFELRSEHLIKLIDAVSTGELRVEHLETVSSWLEASFERFLRDGDTLDGERVNEALFWLGNPGINYPLTREVLMKISHYLVTGDHTFTRADTITDGSNRRPRL